MTTPSIHLNQHEIETAICEYLARRGTTAEEIELFQGTSMRSMGHGGLRCVHPMDIVPSVQAIVLYPKDNGSNIKKDVLAAIENQPGLSSAALANQLHLADGYVHELLRKMETDRKIERVPSPGEKSSHLYPPMWCLPTDKSRAAVDKRFAATARAIVEKWRKDLVQALPPYLERHHKQARPVIQEALSSADPREREEASQIAPYVMQCLIEDEKAVRRRSGDSFSRALSEEEEGLAKQLAKILPTILPVGHKKAISWDKAARKLPAELRAWELAALASELGMLSSVSLDYYRLYLTARGRKTTKKTAKKTGKKVAKKVAKKKATKRK